MAAERATGFWNNYPFDVELFIQMWQEAPDPVLTAMLDSGAMAADSMIAQRISNDGNWYTIPFYNPLDGEPVNYDGQTDIPTRETTAGKQSGIVWGRANSWTARDFQAELSGADPVGHIARSVARYWAKDRQKRLIGQINALFNMADTSDYATQFKETHVLETGDSIGITTANRLMTKSMGDHKAEYSMAIMHSIVAERLENLQVLEFWRQTDANGIQRPLPLASYNGLTVIVDDTMPVDGDEFTTYLFGNGVLRHANGRLDNPVGTERDEATNGGQETLFTRIRETIHPNGFNFDPVNMASESPTDAELFDPENWSIKFNPKAIALAKLVTTEDTV